VDGLQFRLPGLLALVADFIGHYFFYFFSPAFVRAAWRSQSEPAAVPFPQDRGEIMTSPFKVSVCLPTVGQPAYDPVPKQPYLAAPFDSPHRLSQASPDRTSLTFHAPKFA
jgi:hypothetical protein